jgi:hypothetical protein
VKRELKAAPDVAIALGRDAAVDAFSRSASVALPGPRGRTSGADGRQPGGVLSASAAAAVRGCSSSAVAASYAIPFRTSAAAAGAAPDPRVSQPGAAGSALQIHLGIAGLAHSWVSATPATPTAAAGPAGCRPALTAHLPRISAAQA